MEKVELGGKVDPVNKEKHINLWFPHACPSMWMYLCHASKYILVSLCLSVKHTNTQRRILNMGIVLVF